jgi:hypothetical protein
MSATEIEQAPKFLIRAMRDEDRDFIYSSFLRSYRDSDQTVGIPAATFYEYFKVEWESVLSRFTVHVAHPEGDEDEIAGWIACSGPVVAWIYVKRNPWRRMGVGRLLLESAGLPKRCGTDGQCGRCIRERKDGCGGALPFSALYGCRWGMSLAKSKGLEVHYLSHGKAMRMLVGG